MMPTLPNRTTDDEPMREYEMLNDSEHVYLPFAFSPISTSRRMASERLIELASDQCSTRSTRP
jgi:hypothetical protein